MLALSLPRASYFVSLCFLISVLLLMTLLVLLLLLVFVFLPWGACSFVDNSPMLGVWAFGAAELLRPLLDLTLVAGVAITSKSGFLGGFPRD